MIKFGTDGWRALIAEDFTISNVRLVSQAIVNYLKNHQKKILVIGYDNRFFSERYAKEAALVAAQSGIETYLTSHAVPTPALSFSVKELGAGGGIMITASHNPPWWNGIKFKTEDGGSAPPEVTKEFEEEINALKNPPKVSAEQKNIHTFDPREKYFNHLAT
jgi:phosphomannomutase